jgi:hypothetical protein
MRHTAQVGEVLEATHMALPNRLVAYQHDPIEEGMVIMQVNTTRRHNLWPKTTTVTEPIYKVLS